MAALLTTSSSGSSVPLRGVVDERAQVGVSLDLLHVLAHAHRRHDHASRDLLRGGGRAYRERLAEVAIEVLAHEALEQLLLHPLVATRLVGGVRLATARLEEEVALGRQIDRLVADGGVAKPADLARFHQHLIEHDDREELEVFPFLRHAVSDAELSHLGQLYTRVHPALCTSSALTAMTSPPTDVVDVRPHLLRIRATAATLLADLAVTSSRHGHLSPSSLTP